MKVLLSAFACNPKEGSEPGNGWNWAIGLANKGFEVHCITRRSSMSDIDSTYRPPNLYIYYVNLPFGLEALYSFSQATMYLHYVFWQFIAYKKARNLHKSIKFNVTHHVTWGSLQLGSFMYKIPVPFVFGPVGGGQISPAAFKKYFGGSWAVEEKRQKVSNFLVKYNPAFKRTLVNASSIWVSNPDTGVLARQHSTLPIYHTLDAALSSSSFPITFQPKANIPEKLKLLWVGRFMPRKGLFLLLEVMENLKRYPGITLTVVGDGEQREMFLKAISNKGLESGVEWIGRVPFDKVKDYYASHDVFFFTSLRDSCPAQVIEAMAFGMPVVTLNLHGQAIIVNEETGFRCDCSNPDRAISSLTNAILTLYANPAMLNKMSKAAYNFAKQQTWEHKINTVVQKSYPI